MHKNIWPYSCKIEINLQIYDRVYSENFFDEHVQILEFAQAFVVKFSLNIFCKLEKLSRVVE